MFIKKVFLIVFKLLFIYFICYDLTDLAAT